MDRGPTTRCCSAIALGIILLSLSSTGIRAQSSRKPDRTPLSLLPLRTLWTLTLNARLSAAPAFAGPHAYFPLDDGRLLAYDLRNGMLEWSVGARPLFGPAAGQGLLFLAEANQLAARRTDDGGLVWQRAWHDDLAAAPVWDNEWLVLAMRSGQVAALRASDGATIWSQALGRPASTKPALAADRVYVATDDSRVVALDVRSGAVLWTKRMGGPATSLLALPDQVFVGSTDNYFYCLLPSSGQTDWRWRAGADPVGLPVVDADNVYFVGLDNLLRSLSRGHGVQQWVRPLPLRPTRGPLMAGSTLLVTGIAPTLRAYNARTGTPAGEVTTDGEITADPYIIGGGPFGLPRLLVVTRDIAKGTIATLSTRQLEPRAAPLGPLPNPTAVPPTKRFMTPAEPPTAPATGPSPAPEPPSAATDR